MGRITVKSGVLKTFCKPSSGKTLFAKIFLFLPKTDFLLRIIFSILHVFNNISKNKGSNSCKLEQIWKFVELFIVDNRFTMLLSHYIHVLLCSWFKVIKRRSKNAAKVSKSLPGPKDILAEKVKLISKGD